MKKITWDEYFMSLAKVSAFRSKDPNTKVGATLVNKNKRVIGLGYNGMPHGNDEFPWGRDSDKEIDNKYAYVVHAEMNAILNSTRSIEDATMYTTLFPCSTCSKLIAQAGVTKIFYASDKYKDTEDNIIAKKIFKDLGVEMVFLDTFELEIKN